MSYSVVFLPEFARQFANFPEDHQNKILDFIALYEQFGFSDFTKYEGKIAPSWAPGSENFQFAKSNELWHYHIGIPVYSQQHPKYKTSDTVLHFQWPNKGNLINLVDMYDHYTSDGKFYLPPATYLKLE
ncbi:hypothetical protein [Marinobacter nauticus]